MILRWEDGVTVDVRLCRRWFPWPTDNVTLGRTIFAASRQLNAPTLRHEGTHCRDWAERGIWWMLTHPGEREARARLAETAPWPQWGPL